MKSRRIAYVLTHHWVPNFGANLQAYATRRALEARGLTVRFVDYRPPELVEKYSQIVPEAQYAAHAAFVAEHLPMTPAVNSQAEFVDLCADAPAAVYVTGSDAVFRVDATSTRSDLVFPNPYWLVGLPESRHANSIRMAIAPSAMGTRFDKMPQIAREGMRQALERMTHLSARDAWTREQMLSLGCKRDVPLIPDPVFLLADLIRCTREHTGRPYIVLCTQGRLDKRWIEAFTRLAEADGLDTLAVPTPEGTVDEGTSRQLRLPLSPFEWMATIATSSGYVGGRFHPVLISLISGRPVVAIDLYHRHPFARMQSKTWLLMRSFEIERACHSRLSHHFLTPRRVFHQLKLQRSTVKATDVRVNRLTSLLDSYLNLTISQ